MDNDLPALIRLLGLSRGPVRFSPHQTKSAEMLESLSRVELQKIREIYESDFIALGYDFDPARKLRIHNY